MAKINSSLAFALFILNLCGTIALFVLTLLPSSNGQSSNNPPQNTTNFKSKQLNQIGMQSQIKSQEEKKDIELMNLDKDDFVFSYKQLSSQFSSEKKIRKLSQSNDMTLVFLLDLVALFTTFIIAFSFFADPNECCVENSQQDLCCGLCVGSCLYQCCCNPRCRCNFHSNNSGSCLVVLIICVLMYCAVNACGKHASRYVGLTLNMLLSIAMLVLSLIFYFDNKSMYDPGIIFSIISITGFMSLINILGLLLPNLASCSSLRYELEPSNEPIVSPSTYPQADASNQSATLYPQSPSYIPPSSGISNVPTYPPDYSANQGNNYVNPQPGYGVPPPIPLQPM